MAVSPRLAGAPRATVAVLPHVAAVVLTVAVVSLALAYGSKTAGGSDSYGYVSEADLLLSGRVSISQPWTADVPWQGRFAFTPLGYRLSPGKWIVEPPFVHPEPRDRWAIVPTYAPGLPLLMAGAKWIAGHCAMFWVVPLLGGAMILATYGIGLRLGSASRGLVAAWLVATSPPFVLLVQAPMADVPPSAALAVAWWCLLGESLATSCGAAIAVAMAILIRPNLLPMAGVMVGYLIVRTLRANGQDRRRQIWRGVVLMGGVLVGVATTMVLFWAMYGSPFRSGYAAMNQLFFWANVAPNLRGYATWLMGIHTPLVILGLGALFVPASWLWPRGADRLAIVTCAALVLALCAVYLPFDVGDSAVYLRYMLPAWPVLMLGVATILLALPRAVPQAFQRTGWVVALAIGVGLGLNGLRLTARMGWLNSSAGEDRYATVALAVRDVTDERSMIYASQHSGSVRYYGGRLTMGYDEWAWFGRSLTWFSDRGVHPYALLDAWEVTNVKAHLSGQPERALFDRPPIFQYGQTSFYDLRPPAGTVATTLVIPVRTEGRCVLPAPAPVVPWIK